MSGRGKWTPGPWDVDDLYTTGVVENATTVIHAPPKSDRHTGTKVAEATYSHEPCDYYVSDREEAEANARLIAAAPDLLSELQAAHKLLQLALKHMGGERQSLFAAESERLGLGTDGATRYHERAAVLAKATGERS